MQRTLNNPEVRVDLVSVALSKLPEIRKVVSEDRPVFPTDKSFSLYKFIIDNFRRSTKV